MKTPIAALALLAVCTMAATAQDSDQEIYNVGNGISAPEPITQVKGQYTDAARKAKIEGVVVLSCVVRTDGTVDVRSVSRSLDKEFGLDEAAVAAAKGWRFKPAVRNRDKQPVAVRVTIEIAFTLPK
jgi:TonB family protein